MKITITSTGNTLESIMDQRFGRCNYFVIYDTETLGIEFLPNPYKDAEQDAGSAAINILESRNVKKIVSGEFGVKIKPLFDRIKIQMILLKNSDKTIQDIINLLNHKK